MAALMALLAGSDNRPSSHVRGAWCNAIRAIAAQHDPWLSDLIRPDPVKIRVALPAADPPDNPTADPP
ncbi:MAG: hypothetical protein C0447_17150 [Methylobacterium sp.]|nr:hypothetical protein [Methylobacterium sp.]